MLKTESALQ